MLYYFEIREFYSQFIEEYKKKLKFSIANPQKTVKARAKIFFAIIFFRFFYIEIIKSESKKKIGLFPELKNVIFFVDTKKRTMFTRGLTSLFFVQSGSTIAKIDRLDRGII